MSEDQGIRHGLNTYNGYIMHKGLADSMGVTAKRLEETRG